MPCLDGHHGCPDLNAFGDLAEQSYGRHRIEVAWHLGNPERRETVLSAAFPSSRSPVSLIGTRAFLVEPIIKPIRMKASYGT